MTKDQIMMLTKGDRVQAIWSKTTGIVKDVRKDKKAFVVDMEIGDKTFTISEMDLISWEQIEG